MAMNTETAAHAPDLSALTLMERLNVSVAQTQGWSAWTPYHEEPGVAWVTDGPVHSCYLREDGALVGASTLPDYASDPAAWGALLEEELSGWERSPLAKNGTYAHFAWYWEEARDWNRTQGPWRRSIGEAICCAVLQKHGVDPTPYLGE
jgi:hypothetical protein